MLDLNIAFISLIWDLINRKTQKVGRVTFTPQKQAFLLEESRKKDLPRSTPEKEGVSSADLLAFLKELDGHESLHMHQLMILRHGKVIFETAFDPYVRGVWHATYSMCKSVTVAAIGILYDEGRISLEDRVIDFFPQEWTPLNGIKFAGMTVKDLLTMSSGSSFNEVGAISGDDWVKGFFSANIKFTPGSRFDYNSMNTFILSAIVTELTGQSLFDFLDKRLFKPLGISEVFWESSPAGITKGGWGLFLRPEDAAKLGILYMNLGTYNGERILSESFVRMATTSQIDTGMPYNPEYGFQIWMDHREGSFTFNGMLGQDVHCYPDLDMIIVLNGGHESIFQQSKVTEIIRKHFGDSFHTYPEEMKGASAQAYEELMAVARHIEDPSFKARSGKIIKGGWKRNRTDGSSSPAQKTPAGELKAFLKSISGNTYELQEKGVGLMPLMMQVMHNNYTRGISHVRFRYVEDVFYLDVLEGREVFSLPVGFGKGRHGSANFQGEPYIIGTVGRFGTDENGNKVLMLRICFVEDACERYLKIVFDNENSITLLFDETPGSDMITVTLEQVTTGSGNTSPLFNGILSQISPDLIRSSVKNGIRPNIKAERI